MVDHPLNVARDALSGRPASELLGEIATAIHGAESFMITAHVGPDGDALGSAVALTLGLKALGKRARAVTARDIPQRFEYLLPPGVIESVDPADLARESPDVDWFVVLDTSEPERVGGYREMFFAEGSRRICIDHHRTHARDRYDHQLVVPEAPATGSLVLAVLDALKVELTPVIAQALWMAIATDTGWFRFANTGPWALLDAARLAEERVDVEGMYDRVYHDLSPARARLVGHVLQHARIELDGDLVWAALLLADRGQVGLPELDGVIDYLKMLKGARIIAFIVEVEPGTFKLSLRARGNAEVERLARSFGGGGHAKAAGGRFIGRIEDLIDQLRTQARSELAHCDAAGRS